MQSLNRRSFLALSALAAGSALSAAPLAREDRKLLADHLKRTAGLVRASTAGLTQAQWTFKAGPDRWSIQECVEHITLSEDFLRGLAEGAVAKGKPDARNAEAVAKQDKTVLAAIPDRSNKATAPSPLTPTGKWPDQRAALREFAQRRKATMQYVRAQAKSSLRGTVTTTPLGPLDGYQALLMLSAHTERHVKQIDEVKTASGYPK